MRVPTQEYFDKIKALVTEFWNDSQKGTRKTLQYYKKLFNIGNFVTLKMLNGIVDLQAPPTDTDIQRIVESSRQYMKRIKGNAGSSPAIPNRKLSNGDPLLEKFHARELIAELRKRGYRGKLTYLYEIEV